MSNLGTAVCPNCSFHFPAPVHDVPIEIKCVKWRDASNTAEVLYTGLIRGYNPDTRKYTVEVTHSDRGFDVGSVEEAAAGNLISLRLA